MHAMIYLWFIRIFNTDKDSILRQTLTKIDISMFRLKGADHDTGNDNNNDNNIDNNIDNKSESDSNEENTNAFDENDDYVERIANKGIGDLNLGADMQHHRKFEIVHYDEDEEEESINYQLSSSDED